MFTSKELIERKAARSTPDNRLTNRYNPTFNYCVAAGIFERPEIDSHAKEVFMSDDEEIKTIVNRAELAELFEVSLPTVDTWVRKGCPVVERGGRGREWQFHVAEIFNWRIERALIDRLAGR